jgi:hypothetical protein
MYLKKTNLLTAFILVVFTTILMSSCGTTNEPTNPSDTSSPTYNYKLDPKSDYNTKVCEWICMDSIFTKPYVQDSVYNEVYRSKGFKFRSYGKSLGNPLATQYQIENEWPKVSFEMPISKYDSFYKIKHTYTKK